ncbi:MAG: FtsQ-type POTRA domain-containing protein [Ruminococcus sp.]|nr:FtsQ-type POTRA domain-containing protein [Ruminococcus sp.]
MKDSKRKNAGGAVRGNIRTYYALAVVFAALIILILCLTVFFRINSIKVEGVTLYREDQIVNVGGVAQQMNLVRLDTGKIADRLTDNLVYIDKVEVKKKYPATIVISCTEAVKAADIKYKDSYYVLSSSGRILEDRNPVQTGGIPVIEGFELKSLKPGEKLASGDSLKAEILTELLEEISAQKFENVVSVDISSRADIKINYDNRIEIRLGSSVDIGYKISCFKELIAALTDDYAGTLIYNGPKGGLSAIPEEQQLEKPVTDDSSSETDSSAVDAYAPSDGTDQQWSDDTQWDNGADGGYTDDYGYGDGTDGGYTDDYGYGYGADGGYTDDYGYGYGTDGGYTDDTGAWGQDYNNYGY